MIASRKRAAQNDILTFSGKVTEFCNYLTKQRFYQLLKQLEEGGAMALQNHKRGPKRPYRRTDEVVRQVIRHRFLDPDASPEVIAQKLQQTGHPISIRSVQRVIEEFGLQKKTSRVPAQAG